MAFLTQMPWPSCTDRVADTAFAVLEDEGEENCVCLAAFYAFCRVTSDFRPQTFYVFLLFVMCVIRLQTFYVCVIRIQTFYVVWVVS